MTPLGDVDLEDSWVLSLDSDEQHVWLLAEAALGRSHPLFYWPPRQGEQHAYGRARVRLTGEVAWSWGPHAKTAIDASGERDYGDLSGWTVENENHRLEGAWGVVTVSRALVSVDWETSP